MHRALDLILLLVALSGGLLALQNGRQLANCGLNTNDCPR